MMSAASGQDGVDRRLHVGDHLDRLIDIERETLVHGQDLFARPAFNKLLGLELSDRDDDRPLIVIDNMAIAVMARCVPIVNDLQCIPRTISLLISHGRLIQEKPAAAATLSWKEVARISSCHKFSITQANRWMPNQLRYVVTT